MPAADDNTFAAIAVKPEKYPWHERCWSTLTRDTNRLPHALLLHGQAGIGKQALALRLAEFLLCCGERADSRPCGTCQSCALFRAGNHPDLLRIEPLEDSSSILVDQVRGVIEFLSLKAHMATHKVVIISPAEAMNVSAANSLLKILEEPPPGSLLVLVATHLSRVAATIRSRCMQVSVSVPSNGDALTWLQSRSVQGEEAQTLLSLAGGAPLKALTFKSEGYLELNSQLKTDLIALAQKREDPVKCAERWKGLGADGCVEWLYRFLCGAVTRGANVSFDSAINLALPGGKTLSLSIIDLMKFTDMVSISARQIGTGLDESLMLEQLLIRWCEMTATAD